jgi:Zn-finger in ubiquitin-hydrolases and other protein
MKSEGEGINALAEPSGTGCVECLATGGWWLHLRRCTECGHIGCCDNSPNQHASKHNAATGHPIITSFEPGEPWFYDYRIGDFFAGPNLSVMTGMSRDEVTTFLLSVRATFDGWEGDR